MTLSPSVRISGIGAYTPENVVTNDELSKTLETSDEWIRTRTGIRERRIAKDSVHTSDLAVKAAEAAIKDANLNPSDIDLLIVGTLSPDLPFPSTACLVQTKLGLRPIPAFDLAAACSGFLYLLEVASNMVKAGGYKNALIIGAEKMSSVVDWEDRSTCVLFGDGAGACILSPCDTPGTGIIDSLLGAEGSNYQHLYVPAGGCAKRPSPETLANHEHFLKMNGKEIFKVAVRVMGQAALEILERNNLSPEQIKCIVPHQANIRIIDAIAARIELPQDRFFVNVDRYGNTSAASIPIALTEAHQQGYFQKDDYILLVAFGAGLTWGSTLLKWNA